MLRYGTDRNADPEQIFDARWAMALLGEATSRLSGEYWLREKQPRFEVKPSVRALAFGFFHQKPAQRFQLLIDRKESVPKIVHTRQVQAHLIGNGSEKTL